MNNKLFVGFSGPIGYDYWRGGSRQNHKLPPNAVLEDVTGLLLCYEEFYFLSRDFCPKDMWDLPYVKFLSDDSMVLKRAVTAYEQAKEITAEHGKLPGVNLVSKFAKTISTMTDQGRGGIDNHSLGLSHVEGFNRSGNSADANAVLIDRLIADSLEFQHLDVLTNTVASEAVRQSFSHPNTFDDWHVDVASSLGSIRVPNRLGPEGGYHEDIEKLRNHQQIINFREYLRELEPGAGLPGEVALEVSEIADDYARQALQKNHKHGPIYKTVGRGVLGPALDLVLPWVGTIASGMVGARDEFLRRREQRRSGWASFVVSLQQQ